jgi:hypothetical protein
MDFVEVSRSFLAVLILSAIAPSAVASQVDTVLTGRVVDLHGSGINRAQVELVLFNLVGESVWRVQQQSDSSGVFAFDRSTFPVAQLSQPSYAAGLNVEADGYRPVGVELIIERDSAGRIASVPRVVSVRLAALSRSMTVIVFIPALAGVILAMVHFLNFSLGRTRRRYVLFFSMTVTLLWVGVISAILIRFAAFGETHVAILVPGFVIPLGLIVGAFVGTVAYVAFSVYTRDPQFFAPENAPARAKLLQVIGGRLLISPYIAMVAFGILATSIAMLNTGPFAFFFGFFTGLWIKPVLDMLNDVGKRLLSEEARTRLLERARQITPAAVAGWIGPSPSRGLLKLVGDRHEYIVKGRAFSLPVDRSRMGLRFQDGTSDAQQAAIGQRLGLVQASDLEDPDGQFTFWQVTDPSEASYRELARAAEATPEVVRVSPVFFAGEQRRSFATDRIMVKLTAEHGEITRATKRVLKANKGTVVEALGAGNRFVVQLGPAKDPFEVADQLNALDEVDVAEVDRVYVGSSASPYAPDAVATQCGEPFEGRYAYEKMEVPAAWAVVDALNDPADVTVAILDDGVDRAHPDLAPVIIGTFDAYQHKGLPYPQSHDAHGTACAGLAAAAPANDGMKGVGCGCRLLVARVNYRVNRGRSSSITTSDLRVIQGIQWAVRQGADILSVSWGTGDSLSVELEIMDAINSGRGGRGCVVVAAAGNDGGGVAFPASLPEVLAVAATDDTDGRGSGVGWTSNAGRAVDIAAPGVKLFTTDIAGAGKGWGPCDYLFDFEGTSAAAPMVAGAAGLILRAHPQLSGREVRDLLVIAGTEKVGSVRYGPDGRSRELGNGRINIMKALNAIH